MKWSAPKVVGADDVALVDEEPTSTWWVNHHDCMTLIGRADCTFLFGNIALLMCIAFTAPAHRKGPVLLCVDEPNAYGQNSRMTGVGVEPIICTLRGDGVFGRVS